MIDAELMIDRILLDRHYRDECGGIRGCDFCRALARVDDALKVTEPDDVWPVEEIGGEGGAA